MVSIQIKFDELTSMLHSYHILCAPTSLNRQYNPDVFKRLDVSPGERGRYLSYWISQGVTLDKMDSVRSQLFYPEAKSIHDIFSDMPDCWASVIRHNLSGFQQKFTEYFKNLSDKLIPLMHARQVETEKVIDTIYNIAQEYTGVEIERPKDLEIRVVEGSAPSSQGTDVRNGKGYVMEQVRHFQNTSENSYLHTLIHETVAHQTADACRHFDKDVFGKYVYAVEEGFAKLFTNKIAEKVVGRPSDYISHGGLEEVAYTTFENNWDSLNGKNFESWYKHCLAQVRQKTGK